jgi:hypothetical protein
VRLARVCRGLAFAIVVLAILDPAFTMSVRSDAVVAVVAGDPGRDGELARRTAELLDPSFTVVRGDFGGAAGTVLIGSAVPPDAGSLAPPVFVVTPRPPEPPLRIASVVGAGTTSLDATSTFEVSLDLAASRADTLEVALLAEGVPLDRTRLPVEAGPGRVTARLSFTPSVAGPAPLELRARLTRSGAEAVRPLLVAVEVEPVDILFFDPRPSWMSTFVRRTLEQDGRVRVTSRTITSPGIGTTFGEAPPGITGPGALSPFRVVLVGAPELLSEAEVGALEGFLRRRGGTVVLLLDRPAGGPFERLAGVEAWSGTGDDDSAELELSPLVPGERDEGRLIASQLLWPDALPPRARTLVSHRGVEGTPERPVIWQTPVGAGRLLVSGVLDGWRFRDPEQHAFDPFWTGLVGAAAAAVPPAVGLALRQDAGPGPGAAGQVIRAGEPASVRVVLLEQSLSGALEVSGVGAGAFEAGAFGASALGAGDTVRATATARIEGTGEFAGSSRALRLWPSGPPGHFEASLPPNLEAGLYRIQIDTGDDSGDASGAMVVRVAEMEVSPAPTSWSGHDELVQAWAGSRGGEAVPEARLGQLPGRIAASLGGERRRERRHPFRSPWWILPLALLLGWEWWWRRARGMP